tara:strand:- start:324 stop:602 length:279 start_codon:yes stop_codon:yes gene_type:complete
MTELKMSYEDLVERAKRMLSVMLDQVEKAPSRASFNKLLGGWTTSKRDVVKACTENLKNVNMVSQTLYRKDVVTFEDDEPVTIPKININEKK